MVYYYDEMTYWQARLRQYYEQYAENTEQIALNNATQRLFEAQIVHN